MGSNETASSRETGVETFTESESMLGMLWMLWRRALGRWRRRPGLAVLILLSLVLGVGINTAVFTLLDSAFLNPWPIDSLDSLAMVQVTRRTAAGEPAGAYRHGYPDFRDLRQWQSSFEDLAAFHWWPMSLSGGSESIRTKGMYVSAGYFPILGLKPAAGRFFTAEEDAPGAAGDVVVLGHGIWQRLFGGDPGIVGTSVRVNGRPMSIIGVAPRGFVGTELPNSIDFWVPVAAFPHVSPLAVHFDKRGMAIFNVLGRLRSDGGAEPAEAELAELAQRLESAFPKEQEGLGFRVAPLVEAGYRPGDRELFLGYGRYLVFGALLVLMITGVDVAGLLLGQTLERRSETALQLALGASRRRLVASLGLEQLFILALGGLLAVPAAHVALGVLWQLRPPQVASDLFDLSLDSRALGVALGITLLLAGAITLLTLWWGTRARPAEALRGVRQLGGGPRGQRWRDPLSWLVVLQVALAVAALTGSSWLAHQDRLARAIDPGFDAERLAVVSIAPGEAGWDRERIEPFLRRLQDDVAALPGVSAVAVSENRLLRGGVYQRQIFIEGVDEALVIGERIAHRTNAVLPGFFDTVGIELIAGQDFDPLLDPDGKKVVIINQSLAELAWPGEDPIGQRIFFDFPDTEPLEVVGVAKDARYRNLREPRQFFLYLPMSQEPRSSMTLHLRLDHADPKTVLPALRQLLNTQAPDLPIADLSTLSAFVEDDLWLDRASARLMTVFSGLAWLLAALGLYGAISRSVVRRRRELGIRRALGAGSRGVVAPVAREAIEVVAAGAVLAVLAMMASGGAPEGALGRMILPALVIVPIVVLAACFFPCRQALAVTPAEVLRDE